MGAEETTEHTGHLTLLFESTELDFMRLTSREVSHVVRAAVLDE